jgi:hypothetical protein
VILDTDGKTFRCSTPVTWESSSDGRNKADPSQKSFLFTLNNPPSVPARRFAFQAEKKDMAVCCLSDGGPHFLDIFVYDNCNANTDSYTYYGKNVRPLIPVSLVQRYLIPI